MVNQMGRQKGKTTPSQFRLSDEVLLRLDAIADHETKQTGTEYTRTDAIRVAIKEAAEKRGLPTEKKKK